MFYIQTYGQTTTSIGEQHTEDLQHIYSQNHIVGFSVAIVNQERILYSKGFGYSDIYNKKLYTDNTIQNIASISKTFIGTQVNLKFHSNESCLSEKITDKRVRVNWIEGDKQPSISNLDKKTSTAIGAVEVLTVYGQALS